MLFDRVPLFYYEFNCLLGGYVKIRLLTENQHPRLSGSALKVCVVGWWWGGFHSIIWSHQLHIGLNLGFDITYLCAYV